MRGVVRWAAFGVVWACTGCGDPSRDDDADTLGDDTDPSDTDPTDTDPTDPAPTDTDVEEDRAPRALTPDELTALSAGVRFVVSGATRITETPLRDLMSRVTMLDSPECTDQVIFEMGVEFTANCQYGGGELALGLLRWQDGLISVAEGPDLVWLQRWLPAVGETVDPLVPVAAGHPSFTLFARFTWRDPDGPIAHLWGSFSHMEGQWGDTYASRTWGDGSAEDRLAAPDAWTGSDLIALTFEAGRLRTARGDVLMTIDGSLGGLNGDYPSATIEDGAWWSAGAGCTAEPAGVWHLRDTDGRWHDITFDPEAACDGCGTVRAPNRLDAELCLNAADRDAALLLIDESVR